MNLSEQINADIKSAMLAKEKEKLEALRAIKAALLLEQTKGTGEVSNDAEVKMLQKMYKQRNEAAEIFVQQGRPELAETEIFQANIIKAYLPEQMSEEQVKAVIQEVIASVGASSAADMGKVMGPAMAKLQGKADGKLISAFVKQLLG
ncbi:MAG TPA: glutamyl-tRNA amidotransferase [Flavobacteriales bacterium]|nr:glutamyl-tRNA amidotransferase [Flavobacteriales bacterium]HCA83691.1 glutamyl-tRNA amidotransferase [Flavobacteriales bacterium]HRE74993.1 GatB/YqeY domain-containing protein [Flavobacteriales bacterium]HRE95381.1 GatB/YqeY domain-containing protein [Flavobacteriales bacterium]HRJ34544.1 GatB/YqeY domain-containing protein [Flavobacteriales bacterium]